MVVAIYRENPDILLLDCTYPTKRFNLPLLTIVGITAANATIRAAQVFMSGEKSEDYAWELQQLKNLMVRHEVAFPRVFFCDRDLALLNSLESVFSVGPVLLCLRYVTKAVEAHVRSHGIPRVFDLKVSKHRNPTWKN
ncbi:MULE transposase domain-containing protein [Phytophthora infestans]|uniref:MULE transposase domain-containing protein n=1 Tax=Phytophthora infestans TaxID=4787 RepID=A0A833T6K7_PHYIN|nr:MULE transposase domain-containing protein [Phytophthora infestans]